jgi:glycerol-3-phosphate O-acyltransferase
MEFFVEGTRSRTGKSLHPKLGLLSIACQPYFELRAHDITVFPVAVAYNERMESFLYVGGSS